MSVPWSRRDGFALLALVALAAILPLAVGAAAGSLDIPRNDDWSYRAISLHLFQTGRLELDGAAETLLLGQLFFVQPFLWVANGGAWAFWAAGTTFDAIAIVAAYLMARRLLPPSRAVLAAALLPLFPGFLAYATSFMTDVPAASMSFVCLWLGMIAIGRRPVSVWWLVCALSVGVVAFSIRQFALAAPAAVIVAAILTEPRRIRHWVVAIGLVLMCVGILYVRARLAGQLGDPLPQVGSVARIKPGVISVAFVLLPAAIMGAAVWRRDWRFGDVVIGAVLGSIWVVATVIDGPAQAILDNLTSQWGVPAADYLTGGRPLLFPDIAWSSINALAMLATVVVPAVAAGVIGACLRRSSLHPVAILRRLGSAAGILVLFSAATGLGMLVFGLRWSIYDRYLWVLIPPLATLLMSRPANRRLPNAVERERAAPAVEATGFVPRLVAVGGPIIILAGMSLAYLLNSHAFDIARWRAGEALVAEGIEAETIDAGYEWMGTWAPGLPQFTQRPIGGTQLTWYSGLWPEFRLCAFVSSVPVTVPGAELVGIDPNAYRLLLVGGPESALYSYRVRSGGCG